MTEWSIVRGITSNLPAHLSPSSLSVRHGIRQMRTPWADGPEYVTQCPIKPGASYTYRFTIENQDGTLWWHAHSKWLRATVYGAIIIYPKLGVPYPFPKPNKELPILLGNKSTTDTIKFLYKFDTILISSSSIGEWWDRDIISVLRQALFTGAAPNVSDAYTINGQPGDLYRCSSKGYLKHINNFCIYQLQI